MFCTEGKTIPGLDASRSSSSQDTFCSQPALPLTPMLGPGINVLSEHESTIKSRSSDISIPF
jgi:hypothetical protein